MIFSITLCFHDRLASNLTKFSSSPNDPKLGSNEWYWCKCKLYQVWEDLEDLSFQTFYSITLQFHDRLASNLTKFSSSPNDPKLGSNERYWCKCKLYQVWVDLEDLSFQTLIRSSFEFSSAWLLFWRIFHGAQMIQKWVQMKGTDANVSCTKFEWIWKTWVFKR